MVNVRMNFSSMYRNTECNLCSKKIPQTSSHLLECEEMLTNCPELNDNDDVQYDDIFDSSDAVQLDAARLYSKIFKVKQDLDENHLFSI